MPHGKLHLVTEFGVIDIERGKIAVIPRGVKFSIQLPDGPARGYLCEKLRRRANAARARSDWHQLSGQRARFSHASCSL